MILLKVAYISKNIIVIDHKCLNASLKPESLFMYLNHPHRKGLFYLITSSWNVYNSLLAAILSLLFYKVSKWDTNTYWCFRKQVGIPHHPFHKIYTPLASCFYQNFFWWNILQAYNGVGIFTYVCVFHSIQYEVTQTSEMQFCMVDHETGSSTRHHTAEWTSEFCHFSIFRRTHTTQNLSSFQGPMFCFVMTYQVGSLGWWKVSVFPTRLSVLKAPIPPAVLGPWSMKVRNADIIILNHKRWGG
jgi:hypothetical protein